MMKTIKIIKMAWVFLFTLLGINGYTQDPIVNLQKYQTYRENLEYFRIRGTGPGAGLIAATRNAWSPEEASNALNYGDAGIQSGWYIGMLATEYAILTNEGKHTEANNTLIELDEALSAIERLTDVAVSHFNQDPVPNYSYGVSSPTFILRNDAFNDYPSGGIVNQHFYQLNGLSGSETTTLIDLDRPEHWWGTPASPAPWGDVTTTLHSWGSISSNNFDYYSIDQFCHLFMGLKLTYVYAPQLYKDKAKSMLNGILHQLQADGWAILDPNNNPPQGHTGGSDFSVFVSPLLQLGLSMGVDVDDPYDVATQSKKLLWGQYEELNFSAADVDNAHMRVVMAAISGSNTQSQIIDFASDFDFRWEAFYPLLNANLWNTTVPTNILCDAADVLNSAPVTNPEYSTTHGTAAGAESWGTSIKFVENWTDQNTGGGSGAFHGVYSGIDYMLLYNLYRLRQKDISYDQNVWPRNAEGGGLEGTTTSPYVVSNDIVSSTAKVTAGIFEDGSLHYIATDYIVLKDGFHVWNGAFFSARLSDCGFATAVAYDPLWHNNTDNINETSNAQYNNLVLDTEEMSVEKESIFNIFPNPNNGQFNVAINNNETALIEVYDVMGKQVFMQNSVNTSKTAIDLTGQTKGVYVVKVTIGEQVFNEKVVYQ